MDLWLIAATAATGYIAMYLQNLSKSRDKSPEFSSEGSPRFPISRPSHGKKQNQVISTVGKEREIDDSSAIEIPSTSKESSGNQNDHTTFSSLSLMPGFSANEDGNQVSSDMSLDETEYYAFHESFRNRTFLRRKHRYRHLVKPLSPVESFLMAQLHKEQITMEEYVFTPFPSPSATIMRPLLVTNGTREISKESGDSFNMQIQNENRSELNVFGVPPLPKMESNKMKLEIRKGRTGRLSSFSKKIGGRRVHLHKGSEDAARLFCLGVSVGIISSFIASKDEVEKLKQLLKQTENLVHDLQEELEMKDSLKVKGLANKNSESRMVDDQKISKEPCDGENDENSESMSKIEAELEAELERLELNISTSGMERRLSDIIELEPDFVADFAQGKLKTERLKGQPSDQALSNQGQRCNHTPPSGNYAVSPHQLSLRLHEIIISQLEERVKELEIALEESQRTVRQLMESETKNSQSKLWEDLELMRNETYPQIPIRGEDHDNNPMAQPLVMNLAGEALDAYNEAYRVLIKINNSEEEDSPLEEEHPLVDRTLLRNQKISVNYSPRRSEEFARVHELLDFSGPSEGENDEDEEGNNDLEDEMEKRLIKQIVEKTKLGSPVVLNAQKMLFLMDDRNKH